MIIIAITILGLIAFVYLFLVFFAGWTDIKRR
jgi:hypothetical protein